MSNRSLIIGIVAILAAGVIGTLALRESGDEEPAPMADQGTAGDTARTPVSPAAPDTGQARPMLEVGDLAPAFELEQLSGGSFSLADHVGEVVLVNFWATWCEPCRDELPDLQQLSETYGDEGLQVVGVSLDEEGRAVVEEFHQTFPVEYPLLLNGQGTAAEFGAVQAVPTSFLIDPQRRIVARHIGAITRDEFEPEVRRALRR